VKLEAKRNTYPVVRARVRQGRIALLPIGDAHVGSRHYNEAAFKSVLKWGADHDALWVGMGDLMECATKSSIGSGVYEQTMSPQAQIDYLVELLRPHKDRCIGMVKGNHEERAYKGSGIDPMSVICHALQVPYSEWEYFGIIAADRNGEGCAYSVYANHSYTGNKSAGLALNWSETNLAYMGADILLRAHSHDMGFIPTEGMDIDKMHFSVEAKTRYIAMTGHYLKRANSYIAARGGKPKPTETVALWLTMDKDNRKVEPEYLM
jgi:hypothetical protein